MTRPAAGAFGPAGSEGGPVIIGHRGSKLGPENTVEACLAAAAAGAGGVEIDVLAASSGLLIAQHGRGSSSGSDSIEDILRATADVGLSVVLDVKTSRDEADHVGDALAAVLDRDRDEGRVVVSSFSQEFLRATRLRVPWVELYPIVSLRQNLFGTDTEEWDGVSLLAAVALFNPFLWRRARRSGRPLLVWFGLTEWRWVAATAGRRAAGLIVGDVERFVAR